MIKEWCELNRIACRPSNYSIAKKYGMRWLLFILMLGYVVVSGIALWLVKSEQLLIPLLLVAVSLWLMQFVVDTALLNRHHNELAGANRKQKLRLFRYLEFKQRFESNSILSDCNIESLLAWQKIGWGSTDRTNFIGSKFFLVLGSGFMGFLFAFLAAQKMTLPYVGAIFVLVSSIIFLGWALFDIYTLREKRDYEIKRFLEWLLLEFRE